MIEQKSLPKIGPREISHYEIKTAPFPLESSKNAKRDFGEPQERASKLRCFSVKRFPPSWSSPQGTSFSWSFRNGIFLFTILPFPDLIFLCPTPLLRNHVRIHAIFGDPRSRGSGIERSRPSRKQGVPYHDFLFRWGQNVPE